MSTDVRRYVHYRNSALALRAVAGDYSHPAIRRDLLKLADDYERLADVLGDLMRSRLAAA